MVIKRSAMYQYILMYLMMIFNGGVLYPVLQNQNPTALSLISYLFVFIGFMNYFINKVKYGNSYCIIISGVLIVCVILVRLTAGGVGIAGLMDYLISIMLAFLAVCVDKNKFSERLINIVYFFAGISLLCYFVQIISPSTLEMLFSPFNSTFSYNDWSAASYGGDVVNVPYTAWGKLFFTMREGEMSRNLGIYSEPGNYQIVLNCALFILLFLPKLYSFSKRQIRRRFIVIIIAILTTQSTSGYLILLSLCIAFFFSDYRYENMSNVRKIILGILGVSLSVLVIDYNVRGNESFLNTAVIAKLFSNGSVDITASSGYWRLGSIGASIYIMITHPFGTGYDYAFSTIQQYLPGSAGGALMKFGAALGIIPFIITIVWFIAPVIRDHRLTISAKIAFLILYFQTSLAQSKVFYPFIVAIVVLIVVTRRDKFIASVQMNLPYEV